MRRDKAVTRLPKAASGPSFELSLSSALEVVALGGLGNNQFQVFSNGRRVLTPYR